MFNKIMKSETLVEFTELMRDNFYTVKEMTLDQKRDLCIKKFELATINSGTLNYSNCAFCTHSRETPADTMDCCICPIGMDGHRGCAGTPYEKCLDTDPGSPERMEACAEEIRYLKSLSLHNFTPECGNVYHSSDNGYAIIFKIGDEKHYPVYAMLFDQDKHYTGCDVFTLDGKQWIDGTGISLSDSGIGLTEFMLEACR